MLRRLSSLAGSLSLVLLFSCVDWSEYSVDQVELNPSVALPLVTGKLSVSDLMENVDSTIIKVYPDGLVYFTYAGNLQTGAIADMFSLPDKTSNASFILPGGILPATTQETKVDSISRTIDFAMDPERIDEIGLLTGQMAYVTTSSSSNLDYEIRVSIPGFVSKNAIPLNTAVKGNSSINLNEFSLFLDDNKFQMKVTLVLKRRASQVTIPPGTTVNVQLSFKSFQFRFMKGFLGEQSIDLPETSVEMAELGDLFEGAEISLADPKVGMTLTNEHGVPVVGEFVVLEGRKDGSPPLQILLNPPGPVTLKHPAAMGGSEVTTVSITNLNEVLQYAPTSIAFQAYATINKGLTSGNNFVVDTSKLDIKLNVEVPLYGHATGIHLQDTLDIDLSQSEGSEVVKASLKLKVSNQLPLDGSLQLILLDDDYKVLDVLLNDNQTSVLRGSAVTSQGDLMTAGLYDGMIELAGEKIDHVFEASHLVVVLNFQTSRNATGNAQNVKFKADYGVEIEAGILADFKMKIK
jgi:hypothetical protein